MATTTTTVPVVAYLVPNSDLFKWKGQIFHLPGNIAKRTQESKELFMRILDSLQFSSMKQLTPEQQKAAFNNAWVEYVTKTPLSQKDQFIKTTLLVIEIAGMAVLFVISARACL
jgi:hypothetical protein